MGDCNGDGSVDAADLTCVADLFSRDAVLDEIISLPGDFDGDGDVAFEDFLVLSANFGQEVGYADGNVDLEGSVDFADFLVLSANFGQSAKAAATVPEPTACGLIVMGLLGCVILRRRTTMA